MKFADMLAADRRLVILRLLVESNGSANESVLLSALEALGHGRATQDDVRTDLRFLKEVGAIRLEWFMERIAVAHLLVRGTDIAQGKVTVEGIKRPKIGE